ncbi:vitamin K epoxide reductase family protein [Gloeobacter kilaueensis]|uniref:Vitamin K epoxide reductase n=1 Tax=Gloeobacter kilaueensis (strain ATCC BAA-2537 / CCAP 1431/1 / ULC 316 / JS1) TaxID=1183438 RepID=U5QJW4_GLOK1|nr:vitamin K epoxide reductase family protein [Gloeobacter kilaueensis]AGY59277.1 vitamin K epoxide reductase [Gloeobacter kilaueensis JS1]
MQPRQLSNELRHGQSPDLNRRRWVIGLSLLAGTMGKIVSLYQTGIVRHLPDPPVPGFDSDRVDASDYAYKRLETPDGLFMIANYALTAILAGAGGADRARTRPLLPLLTAAKTLIDAGVCLELAREEWQENKAFCAYCQVATVASLASAAIALPEALAALRQGKQG